MSRLVLCGLLVLNGAVINLTAQAIDDAAYPTEDEVIDAQQRGDLSTPEAEQLIELLRLGIPAGAWWQANLIPGVTWFEATAQLWRTVNPNWFTINETFSRVRSYAHLSYAGDLNDRQRHRWRMTLNSNLDNGMQIRIGAVRELTGRERLIQRSLTWRTTDSLATVQTIRLGTAPVRIGLGSAVGYRGAIFPAAGEFDETTLSSPDYGGHDGAQVTFRVGGRSLDLLWTHRRNDSLRLSGAVVSLGDADRGRWSITSTWHQLRYRTTSATQRLTLSAFGRTVAGSTVSAVEGAVQITGQDETARLAPSLRFEGVVRRTPWTVGIDAWWVDDAWLDISGSAVPSRIRRTVTVPNSRFQLSDRLAGQVGVVVRSSISLAGSLMFNGDFVGSRLNDDTAHFDVGSSLRYAAGQTTYTIGWLSRHSQGLASPDRWGGRFEISQQSAVLRVTNRLEWRQTDGNGEWHQWSRARIVPATDWSIHLWSRFGPISSTTEPRWYGYIETNIAVDDGTRLGLTYSGLVADDHDRSRTLISVDVELIW